MSHDVYLKNEAGQTLETPSAHQVAGGTYAVGGTTEAWLNITYNYAPHLWRVLGDGGVRTLYGRRAGDTIPLLRQAISELGTDVDADYWKPTEGNARRALEGLLALAEMLPDGIWAGD